MPVVMDVDLPLDGDVSIALVMSPDANLMLLDQSGQPVAAAGQVVNYNDCGERSLKLKVFGPRPGRFSITVQAP